MRTDFTKEIKSHSVKNASPKILIESMHGMGDLVCILPLIREVREYYPNAYIAVMINNSSFSDVLDCSNIKIDRIISVNAHKTLFRFLLICYELRKYSFDISISSSCTPIFKAKLVMSLINAKEKYGYQFENKDYGCLYSHYHFVDANNLVLNQMGIRNHNYKPQLFAKENDLKNFKIPHDKTVVGVCIGRADPSFKNKFLRTTPVYTKGWGELELHIHNMNDLIKKLINSGCYVVLLGSKKENIILESLSKEILSSNKCINYVDKTSISESIALVNQCDVVFGVDTGMQHVSDAVGIRTVSIFGPTNPRTQGAYSDLSEFVEHYVPCKYCYGTENYVKCNDRKCLSMISPDKVIEVIKKQISSIEI